VNHAGQGAAAFDDEGIRLMLDLRLTWRNTRRLMLCAITAA
jgi:hypothetical protein